MNPRKLKIFSQNVRKNKILTDIILETNKTSFDIIFLQEPLRYLRHYEPSHSNPKGDPIYGAPLHPEWISSLATTTTLKTSQELSLI